MKKRLFPHLGGKPFFYRYLSRLLSPGRTDQ